MRNNCRGNDIFQTERSISLSLFKSLKFHSQQGQRFDSNNGTLTCRNENRQNFWRREDNKFVD